MYVPHGAAGPPPIPSNLQPPGKPAEADKDIKLRPVFSAIWAWMSTMGQFVTRLAQFTGYYQLNDVAPAKHNATHLPDSEFDPLPVGTPSGLANANAEGSANAYVRQDHQHKRDVRVQYDGSDIGTRNALNFTSSGSIPVDDPGGDKVDVPLVGGDAIAMAFLGL